MGPCQPACHALTIGTEIDSGLPLLDLIGVEMQRSFDDVRLCRASPRPTIYLR